MPVCHPPVCVSCAWVAVISGHPGQPWDCVWRLHQLLVFYCILAISVWKNTGNMDVVLYSGIIYSGNVILCSSYWKKRKKISK